MKNKWTNKEMKIFAILRGEKEMVAPKAIRKATKKDEDRAKKFLGGMTIEKMPVKYDNAFSFIEKTGVEPRLDAKGRFFYDKEDKAYFNLMFNKSGVTLYPTKKFMTDYPDVKMLYNDKGQILRTPISMEFAEKLVKEVA